MSDDLIKRLRHISRLDAENYGALPEDAAEWKAADTIEALRAENEELHTKLAQFTKWNSELTAKCNWYNCDGARLERENEALKQQVEQGKRDAESWRAYKKRKDEVIAAGMGKKILRDAAAPKQEK